MKIAAKYSCDNGNEAVASKFSAELGHIVTESTVRNMKAYLSLLKKEKDPDKIKTLPHAARGRPLLLQDYDKDVASYIKSLREAVGICNRSIVIPAAKGIVSYKNPALLREHGLERSWAELFLRLLGYVKRKATPKLPENLAEVPPSLPRFLYLTLLRQGKSLSLPWTIQPLLCFMSSRLIDVTLSYRNYVKIIFIRCSFQLDALRSCNHLMSV